VGVVMMFVPCANQFVFNPSNCAIKGSTDSARFTSKFVAALAVTVWLAAPSLMRSPICRRSGGWKWKTCAATTGKIAVRCRHEAESPAVQHLPQNFIMQQQQSAAF